jgi:septal ring factor EnvC (AmiA/AmiB activator)
MANESKAVIIAGLVTDPYSGFKDGDEPMLETASDQRLTELRAATDARRVEDNNKKALEKDITNTSARLKVAEDRLKASEATLSEEEFIQRAPDSIKTLLEEHKAKEAQQRGALISRLKECGANTEAELKAKSTDELETLAAYAQIRVPDYSGRGIPKERHASDKNNYAAPDPYADGLAKMRGGSKAVN